MNKKLFLTLAAGIFTLLSCSDNIVEIGDSSIKSTAKVTIVVTDAIEGSPIPGATVTLMSGKSTKAAKEEKNLPGTYVFEKVNVGSHSIMVEAGNYASMILEGLEVYGEKADNIYIAQDASGKIDLYPTNSELEGYVRFNDKNGKSLPAEGATVKVMFSDVVSTEGIRVSFVNKVIPASGITDSDGKYTFKNLPAAPLPYEILVEAIELGGISFQASTLPCTSTSACNAGLLLGTLVSNGTKTIKESANAEVFVVSNYTNIIKYNELSKAVEFTFTAAVDTSKFLATTIDLGTEYADIKWSENYTKLTLTPAKWDAKFDACFDTLYFKSATNKNLKGGSTATKAGFMCYPVLITTVELPKAVEDLKFIKIGTCESSGNDKVTEGTASGCFSWKAVEGATGYELLCKIDNIKKPSNDKNYVSCGPTAGIAAGVTQAQANFGAIGGDTVRVWVRAFNDQYITPFDASKIVKLWDKNAPELTFSVAKGDAVVTIADLKEHLNSKNSNSYSYCWATAFPESMNPAAITVSALSTPVSRLTGPTHRWVSDNKNLCFDFKIDAGNPNSSDVDVTFSISGLKDAIGNDFIGKYTGDQTENKIVFRIYATAP